MTAKDLRNVSASVLARLLARAKGSGEDYSALPQRLPFCERFLHRLDQSRARGRFVLKGATLLRLWSDQPYRATRDIDFLRKGDGSAAAIRADIAAVCRTVVVDDGVAFDAASIRVRAIRAEDEYAGPRVTLAARIGSARMPFQVDVGVGDAAWPPPKVQPYPALLEFPAPKILAYQPEAVIAEKLEAISCLGRSQQPHQGLLRHPPPRGALSLRSKEARRSDPQDVRAPRDADPPRTPRTDPRLLGESIPSPSSASLRPPRPHCRGPGPRP